jgi:dCMP deaminase
MRAVLQSGIKRIYYANDYKNHEYCYHLLKVAGAEAIKLESEVNFTLNSEEESHNGKLEWKFKRNQ